MFVAALFLAACQSSPVVGSGNMAAESRAVNDFNAVSLAGTGTLIITQGETESLTIEADDNILPLIRSDVRDGKLSLRVGEPGQSTSVRPTLPIRYLLAVNSLNELEVSGSAIVETDSINTSDLVITMSGSGKVNIGNLQTDNLTMTMSGSGDARINNVQVADLQITQTGSGDIQLVQLQATTLHVEASGTGTVAAAGQLEQQDVNLPGSGHYQAGELVSQQAVVVLTGSSRATLWVEDSLEAAVSGSGQVTYYGQPQLAQTITGSGRINSLGSR